MRKFTVDDVSGLERVAAVFCDDFPAPGIYIFDGGMGVGKTTFMKAICRRRGVLAEVTSPTFAIVNEYVAAERMIYHLDLYRIEKVVEVFDIGFEEYLNDAAADVFIEWPDLVRDFLPPSTVTIKISCNDRGTRTIEW